jgi:hypothetical protein
MSMKLTITTAALAAALAGLVAGDEQWQCSRTRAIQELQQSLNTSPQFAGYPTDYLMNRFSDRQMQGR